LTRRDLGITGLISQYETNPGFIKIRPQGLKTDGTVRITVVCSVGSKVKAETRKGDSTPWR
jgi:hypothetical protein